MNGRQLGRPQRQLGRVVEVGTQVTVCAALTGLLGLDPEALSLLDPHDLTLMRAAGATVQCTDIPTNRTRELRFVVSSNKNPGAKPGLP